MLIAIALGSVPALITILVRILRPASATTSPRPKFDRWVFSAGAVGALLVWIYGELDRFDCGNDCVAGIPTVGESLVTALAVLVIWTVIAWITARRQPRG